MPNPLNQIGGRGQIILPRNQRHDAVSIEFRKIINQVEENCRVKEHQQIPV